MDFICCNKTKAIHTLKILQWNTSLQRACFYFFVNKDGGQLEKALCADNSKFLLHAAYEELNQIQIVIYIYPLQIMIKTLRAQMGSKTLTRVPLMKLHLQVRPKNCFDVMLAASVVRKNIEQTIFRYL